MELTEAARVPGAADRAVGPTLRAAYQSALRGRRQLDAIAIDIETAVAKQQALSLDTPAGAAEFSRFLRAKTLDINQVVAQTVADSRAGALECGRHLRFATRVVISASDGKIITAFPQTKG